MYKFSEVAIMLSYRFHDYICRFKRTNTIKLVSDIDRAIFMIFTRVNVFDIELKGTFEKYSIYLTLLKTCIRQYT